MSRQEKINLINRALEGDQQAIDVLHETGTAWFDGLFDVADADFFDLYYRAVCAVGHAQTYERYICFTFLAVHLTTHLYNLSHSEEKLNNTLRQHVSFFDETFLFSLTKIIDFLRVFFYVRGTENVEKVYNWIRFLLVPDLETSFIESDGNLITEGKYTKAEFGLLNSIKNAQKLGNRRLEAVFHISLGVTYYSMGFWERAEKEYESTLALLDSSLVDEDLKSMVLELKAGAWMNLGQVYIDKGGYSEAHNYTSLALSAFKRLGDKVGEAKAQGNIAVIYRKEGNIRDGINYLLNCCRSLYKSDSERDRYTECILLYNLGALHFHLLNPDTAAKYVWSALRIAEELGDIMQIKKAVEFLGRILSKKGEYQSAIDLYDRYTDFFVKIGVRLDKDEHAIYFFEQTADLWNNAIQLCLQSHEYNKLLQYLERSKQQILLHLVQNTYFMQSAPPSDLLPAQIDAYRQIQLKLLEKHKFLYPATQKEFACLLELSKEIEHLAKELPDNLQQLIAIPVSPSLKEIQKLLEDENEMSERVLVEYYLTKDVFRAFVITNGELIVPSEDLNIFAKLINDKIDSLLSKMDNPTFLFRMRTETSMPQETRGLFTELSDLYDMLIEPLKHILPKSEGQDNVPHIIFVPHGKLHYLPFSTLYDKKRDKYLVELYTLSTVPSTGLLKTCRDKNRKSQFEPFLGIGNPKTEETCLPYAQCEIESVIQLLRANGYKILNPFFREHANRKNLLETAPNCGVLHIGAHHVLDADNPMNSYIALSGDGTPPDNIKCIDCFESGRYSSALEIGDEGKTDRFTSLDIVSSLRLPKATLAVLSICRSGRAEISAGDDFVGLIRSVFLSGVPSILVSTWEVPDIDATVNFMVSFYQSYTDGADKAVALRKAQLSLIADRRYSNPYFWGLFSLSGDYRRAET